MFMLIETLLIALSIKPGLKHWPNTRKRDKDWKWIFCKGNVSSLENLQAFWPDKFQMYQTLEFDSSAKFGKRKTWCEDLKWLFQRLHSRSKKNLEIHLSEGWSWQTYMKIVDGSQWVHQFDFNMRQCIICCFEKLKTSWKQVWQKTSWLYAVISYQMNKTKVTSLLKNWTIKIQNKNKKMYDFNQDLQLWWAGGQMKAVDLTSMPFILFATGFGSHGLINSPYRWCAVSFLHIKMCWVPEDLIISLRSLSIHWRSHVA